MGLILLALGLAGVADLAWFQAHGHILLGGFLLPLLAAAHAFTLQQITNTTLDAGRLRLTGLGMFGGAVLLTLGKLFSAIPGLDFVAAIGMVAMAAFGTIYAIHVMKSAPKKGLTNTEDPLTKGDDACLKHVHFSHRFLALGLLLLAVWSVLSAFEVSWASRMLLTGQHVLLIGFGLLSLYGIGHFWVPRFSGVPAIAAGAIKGELHTTLLGLTGLIAGFLSGIDGLTIGLGFFVFVGFFTYMGVLGANIMRNKSKTQRVTPEFVYIPWTFTGIFWLISAVLLGLFLNAVPDVLAERGLALRYTHIHMALWGGAVQLLMSWSIPAFAAFNNAPLPRFDGRMKGSFYAFNGAITLAIWAQFTGAAVWAMWTALGLTVLALALFGRTVALKRTTPVALA